MLGGLSTTVAGLWLWLAPVADTVPVPMPAHVQMEVERLQGHELHLEDGHYQILDIAGEGAPIVGCVASSERGLEVVTEGERLLLRGPLAVPRIAGPHYKVWVIGSRAPGHILDARRLGILAGPGSCEAAPVAGAAEPG